MKAHNVVIPTLILAIAIIIPAFFVGCSQQPEPDSTTTDQPARQPAVKETQTEVNAEESGVQSPAEAPVARIEEIQELQARAASPRLSAVTSEKIQPTSVGIRVVARD